MATYGLSPIGNEEIHNSAGEPAEGWKLYFYKGGIAYLPKKDSAGAAAWTSPISLNSRGEAGGDIFLDCDYGYDVVFKDGDGATILTLTDVSPVYPSDTISTMKDVVDTLETEYQGDIPLLVDTGIVNALVVTPVPAVDSYTDGLQILFTPIAENTTTTTDDYASSEVTINVSGLGNKSIYHNDGTELKAGDLKIGGTYLITYNGSAFYLETKGHRLLRITNSAAPVDEGPMLYVSRLSPATGSAGTPGNVNSCISAYIQSFDESENGYWAMCAVADSKSIFDKGAVVGIYGQGNKIDGAAGNGGTMTWACALEANDKRTDTTVENTHLRGLEVLVRANGADTNTARCGIDVVTRMYDGGGTACEVSQGLIIRSDDASYFNYGVAIGDTGTAAVLISSEDSTYGIWVHSDADLDYGFYTIGATLNVAAVAVGNNHVISLGDLNEARILYDAGGSSLNFNNVGGAMMFFDIATSAAYFSNDVTCEDMNVTGDYYVDATKVVGVQDTGWTFLTGTADKASNWDTSTVTLEQLARRMSAMETALSTHGLLST